MLHANPVDVPTLAPVGFHPHSNWTLMISRTAVFTKAGTVGSSIPDLAARRLGLISAIAPVGLVRAGRGLA